MPIVSDADLGLTEARGPALRGGPTFTSRGRPTLEAFDMARVDPNVNGWDYLKQFPQEVEAAARAYMNGDVMPTGNPRSNGINTVAKMAAQKIAMDLGQPNLADDTLFAERRKMRTDIGSSSAGSMGGIISNGKSAFEHLANLSAKYAQLGNYNFGDFPGTGYVAEAANAIGNYPLASSRTFDRIQQINDNALKYGQEATKFYAASGGGEHERMAALRGINPHYATSAEMAGFLQTEKELMLGRLRQKEAQIRNTLGDQYLAEHPVMTGDLREHLNRIDTNITALRGEVAPAPARSQTAVTTPAAPPPRPRTGEVRDGYIFLGGNPADPARWQQTRAR